MIRNRKTAIWLGLRRRLLLTAATISDIMLINATDTLLINATDELEI